MPKGKNRRHSKSGKNRTPISGHTLVGKELLPPFARFGSKLKLTSWMNDRLPEMVWAALIRASADQPTVIAEFRRIIHFIAESADREHLYDVTLTGIAKLNAPLQEAFIAHILKSEISSKALCTLKLFEALPARETWIHLLPQGAPNVDLLMAAVGTTLWHQSQEATDCRWFRMVAQLVAGKLHVPREMAEEWMGYPDVGDQRSVRPGIRASEITENPLAEPDLTWPKAFWDEAWRATPCFVLNSEQNDTNKIKPAITRSRLKVVSDALEEHWEETHSTTAVDPKHDATFGIAFYCLRLFDELLNFSDGTGVVGRLVLRTLLEARITLSYLISSNDVDIWKKWRVYGAGQAKLSALKFDSNTDAPEYIDIESIEQIAGEDIWEEFLSINLGNWGGIDLRKMSERTHLKDLYDQHYSWTSGYVHSTWGPVREACFQTCGNPIHRLHRYPERKPLGDTTADAADLLDQILKELDAAYPSFNERLVSSVPEQTNAN